MFDSEAGMFALDEHIVKPTLINGLKVNNMSLGPKSLLIQRFGSDQVTIQGHILSNNSDKMISDPSSFFKEMLVTDFVCGRSMLAFIAKQKPIIWRP